MGDGVELVAAQRSLRTVLDTASIRQDWDGDGDGLVGRSAAKALTLDDPNAKLSITSGAELSVNGLTATAVQAIEVAAVDGTLQASAAARRRWTVSRSTSAARDPERCRRTER